MTPLDLPLSSNHLNNLNENVGPSAPSNLLSVFEYTSAYGRFMNRPNGFNLSNSNCTPSEALRKQMLILINKVRAQPRACGVMEFGEAPPVQWNVVLEEAARLHSHKMATQNFFAHRGPDSTHVGNRVQEVGYNWRFVGENIYAGIETVTEAVYGWLESEGHCKTIMNPDYTELGAACVSNRSSQYELYWTQVFASPM